MEELQKAEASQAKSKVLLLHFFAGGVCDSSVQQILSYSN